MLPKMHALRQSAAELLACSAVMLFPKTHLIGSATSDIGFYYDFVFAQPIDEQILIIIEEQIRSLIKKKLPIRCLEMLRENAVDFLLHHKLAARAEVLEGNEEGIVQIFEMGNFVDSAIGPFVETSEETGVVKLQAFQTFDAYFEELGDVTVTRIIGTSFPDNYELKRFLKRAEQAKKRDHRRLGPEMNLFSLMGDETTGCWLWHSKGAALRDLLIDSLKKAPYCQNVIKIATPLNAPSGSLLQILNKSGLKGLENELLDPSTFHALNFKTQRFNESNLPIGYQEIVLRSESILSSEPWGLFNTPTSTFDLTHLFCSKEQIESQLISCLQFIEKFIKIFGFEHRWYLQVKGAGSKDSKSFWKKSIDYLSQALTACGIEYTLDTQSPMRYGPRAEVKFIDSLEREWTGPFIGIDITHPERLGLRYQGNDDHEYIPVMIVCSLYSSIERFIALMIEHYAGVLPLWLTPEQVRVIPLSKNNAGYANKISAQLVQAGFRSKSDFHPGTLGEKVHLAEAEKIPFIAIVGDNEEKKNVIALRSDNNGQKKASLTLEQILQLLQQEGGSYSLSQRLSEDPNNR